LEENKNICLNCNTAFAKGAKYCSTCSQKTRSGKVTVREYLAEFFNEVFNLNSKLFKTLGALLIPGKLTKEYFLGKRKSYAPPIRLFLVMLIIFFGVESYMESMKIEDNVLEFGTRKKARQEMIDRVDNISIEVKEKYANRDTDLIDTLNVWFKDMNYSRKTHSFVKYNHKKGELESVEIPVQDITSLSEEEFNTKYGFHSGLNQFLSKQRRKLALDISSFGRFVVGSMTWLAFLLLPLLAGLFKLFYRKQDFYFVEHLVFLFHVHSFTFFLALFIWLGTSNNLTGLNIILVVAIMLYWLFSLKNVYQESWGKTIFKSGLILFSYLITFVVLMLIFIFLSFLLF